MPGVVRQGDSHAGHASPTPNPFHKTTYVSSAQTKVYANSRRVIVDGDKTGCGDPAVAFSSKCYAGTKLIHRLGDATGGHGSWVPNQAATASGDVFSA